MTLSNALEMSRAQMLAVLPLLTISSTIPRIYRVEICLQKFIVLTFGECVTWQHWHSAVVHIRSVQNCCTAEIDRTLTDQNTHGRPTVRFAVVTIL